MASFELVDESGTRVFRGTQRPPQGGGSQTVEAVRVPISFDTPGFQARGLQVVSATAMTKTFELSAETDISAFFPPASIVTVTGSSANDGEYTVASASWEAGDLTVVVVESIPDDAGDGIMTAPGAGIIVYEPSIGDILLFAGVSIPTAFDGSAPNVEIGWADYINATLTADASVADSENSTHMNYTSNNMVANLTPGDGDGKMAYFTTTDALQAVLDNGSGIYPGATVGECEVVILVIKAAS